MSDSGEAGSSGEVKAKLEGGGTEAELKFEDTLPDEAPESNFPLSRIAKEFDHVVSTGLPSAPSPSSSIVKADDSQIDSFLEDRESRIIQQNPGDVPYYVARFHGPSSWEVDSVFANFVYT